MKKHPLLVDVRSTSEFQQGSIAGAINIPVEELDLHLNSFVGQKFIVLFCESGSRSAQARQVLLRNGFHNVINGGSISKVARHIKG